MDLHIIKIKEALNKAYLKLSPTRSQIESFKKNIKYLLKQVKDSEGEEFHKNEISEFLKKTYYSPNHYINTKGRYDLVIHNTKDSNGSVGLIVECKSPVNISEMPTKDNLKVKAVLELILYYLRERITNNNLEIKHLIATNLYEWFIFDAHEFEKLFAENKFLIKQFKDFEEGRLSGKDTSFFYNSVASPFLQNLRSEIKFTHVDIRDYEKIINNDDRKDDNLLIPLHKIFSPEHLLKLQFKNDSNSLDKDFYRELLHIIGLEETKQGNKKLIGRASEKNRNYGSLLESTISILNAEDLVSQIPRLSDFGSSKDEHLFNISLELVITWINRILFLKLLESQLFKYNQGDKNFKFLNHSIIPDFDSLNKLFFHILAIPESGREERLKEKFKNIPYLNSSLFEPTDLERRTIRISNLDNENKLPIHKSTILNDRMGKRISGENYTLAYLFEFLDSYNFSSEGEKGIQEDNKSLINASVLGLIFEKINGYKDGSFFTPGFITQYMSHETITRAVVQKFNETKGWDCETLIDVHNKIEDKQEANDIINSLRVCDPAVGSGHFLVSALNELLSIKSELKILMDRQGRVLREYHFEVINDELTVSDPDGEPFEYNPKNKESQRVQEAIFHEKQTILENCLFGVDINPNSVKICRLRLWIELLKHAYYKIGTRNTELETLPNIDINIKCGNSLISRYSLDVNIKSALKDSKWTVDSYREAVMNYRNASSKEEKRTLENLISKIKNDFATEVSRTNQDFKTLNKYKNELLQLTSAQLFEYDCRKKKDWQKRLETLKSDIEKLEMKISEIKNNKVFKNAFEWRFEFPEVLSNDGEFIGFDLIIGNPPYLQIQYIQDSNLKTYWRNIYQSFDSSSDVYCLFYELGLNILKKSSSLAYITSNKFVRSNYGKNLRVFLSQFCISKFVDFGELPVFESASTFPLITIINKTQNNNSILTYHQIESLDFTDFNDELMKRVRQVPQKNLTGGDWLLYPDTINAILKKLSINSISLNEYTNNMIFFGLKTGRNEAYIIDESERDRIVSSSPKYNDIIKPIITGNEMRRYRCVYDKKYVIVARIGINIDDYPLVKDHLIHYKSTLEERSDKGPEWWQLRSCDYYDKFEKTKIHIPAFAMEPRFSYDDEGYYSLGPAYFISSDDKYLLAIMNSKLFWYFLRKATPVLGNDEHKGRLILRTTYIKNYPIKKISIDARSPIITLVDNILAIKKTDHNVDTLSVEKEIDKLVYELYGLTDDEIQVIENN